MRRAGRVGPGAAQRGEDAGEADAPQAPRLAAGRARISVELEADGFLVVRASPRGWAAVEAEERAVEE